MHQYANIFEPKPPLDAMTHAQVSGCGTMMHKKGQLRLI